MTQETKPKALTQLTDDERLLQTSIRDFARYRIAPLVRQMDESAQMDPGLIQELFALGLMGIEIPERFGGTGGTFFDSILAVEALSQTDPSVGVMVDVQNTLCVNALLRWATPEQQSAYLPRLAEDTVGSFCLSEAASGSDAFALQTRATKQGDNYILNGQKLWITNAKEASLFLVFATLDPALGYKGVTAFLVEKGTPGFTIEKKEDKLGIRASSTCALTFADCVHSRRRHPRRTRPRLQDRHRGSERGPHWDWRADARPRAGSVGARRQMGRRPQTIRPAARRIPGHALPTR